MQEPLTPIFDRWLSATARLREAELAFSQRQVACLRNLAPAPTAEEIHELARLRAEAATLLVEAMAEVRELAGRLGATNLPPLPDFGDVSPRQTADR